MLCSVAKVFESTAMPSETLGQREYETMKTHHRPMSPSKTELVNVQEHFQFEITDIKSVLDTVWDSEQK